MSTKVSIVILNWNGADMMRKYLPSVIEHSKIDGVEVVVADNGSTDGSVNMLHREFPGIKVIAFDRNYGFADGYNKAFEQIEAEYFLLLNSDVEVRQDNWLSLMIDYMDTHQDVCACQPKLMKLTDVGSRPFEYAGAAGGFIDKYGYPYCRGRIFNSLENDHGQYDTIVPLHWATGAALMVRSKCYREVGGLDGRFFAHMEEIDLCWRMRIAGGTIVCIPSSSVYHLGGATLSQGNPRKTFLNFRNNLLMLHKNLPLSQLNTVLFVRHILDLVAAFKFLCWGDIANMKAVLNATSEFRRIRYDFERTPGADRIDNKLNSFSILWQYYVKGKHVFSELPKS